MARFRNSIAQHADRRNALHARVRETFGRRDSSSSARADWEKACAAFRGFRSEIDDLLDRARTADISEDVDLREFAFDYLEVDPIYFRSGYAKEQLFRRMKALDLTEEEQSIVETAILNRIRTGARREFRQLCRLLRDIPSEVFLGELEDLSRSSDHATSRRARLALSYLV